MLSDYLYDRYDLTDGRAGPAAAYVSTVQTNPAIRDRIQRLSYVFDKVYVLSSAPEEPSHEPWICLDWKQHDSIAVYSDLEVNQFSLSLGLHNGWDLPAKRSVALAHARERDFAVALLIDDDIWPATAADLNTFRYFGNRIAGKPPRSAEDISATEYVTGLYSYHSFPNGNYLFVDPLGEFSFFPTIYNDDWLFIMSSPACRPTLMGGNPIYQVARQVDLMERSYEQEFGEVFVDGLARAIDSAVRDTSFWNSVLGLRKSSLVDALAEAPASPARDVVASALAALLRFKPKDFYDCDQLWRLSQKAWQRSVVGRKWNV
jgi:hypothetical protein